MSVKILFTADNHIGISYSSFPKVNRELIKERMASFERMIQHANNNQIQYFIIGGDLFDKTTISEKRIKEVATALNSFQGELVIIIPGNHDFYESSPDSLWSIFSRYAHPDKVAFLNEYIPFEHQSGNQTVIFYPAGCRSLHSADNVIGWVKDIDKDKEILHIGIAHGNVTGLGLDESEKYFNMSFDELRSSGLDLWLLGHIHVPYPSMDALTENPGMFMAGTHMPDSWKYKHQGNAWIIEIDEEKKIRANKFRPTETYFAEVDFTIHHLQHLTEFQQILESYKKENTAIRITLTGRANEETIEATEETLKQADGQFLSMDVNNNISRKIDHTLIDKLYPSESTPHILLTELLQEDGDGLAVQLAYDILTTLPEKK